MANSGNQFARNQGLNPAVNFNFMLRVEGVIDVPCKSVHAFQRENEYELIQEGGLNDYVHMRRKPISKPFTFQVERYVGVDATDPLANGTELILPVILYVNRNTVYGKGKTEVGEFAPVRMYVFTGCTVMSKEYGGLDAEKSGLLTETTTIAYREMVCIENLATTSQDAGDLWEFTDDGSKAGNGKQSARPNPNKEDKLTDMSKEALKHLWSFDKKTKAGTGEQNRKKRINSETNKEIEEASISTLSAKAQEHLWKFSGKSREGNKKGVTDENRMALAANETRLDKMSEEAKKHLWEFNGTAKAGKGEQNRKKRINSETNKEIEEKSLQTMSDEAVKHLWEFGAPNEETGASDMKGKGARSAVVMSGEKRLDDMSKAAESNQWKLKGNDYNGAGKRFAEHPKGEKRKTAMEREVKRNIWQFGSEAGNINGLGRRSAVRIEDELRRRRMENLGQKWEFDGAGMGGNGKQSAEQPEGEKRKPEMSNLGRRWPDTKSAVDIAEFLSGNK